MVSVRSNEMAKRCLLILTLLCLCAFSAFSLSSGKKEDKKGWNENNEKNFVSVDVYALGGGLRYERFLSPKLSVGADVYWNIFLFTYGFEAGAFARYYPLNNGILKGLYGELGLGWGLHSYEETETQDYYSVGGVDISPSLGLKFDPGNAGGFFVEPGISIPITIGEKTNWRGSGKEFGAGIGFVVYCGLGWAF
jgi:hypothetical protein